MDRKYRTRHARQRVIERPHREGRIQPLPEPGVERPRRLAAVVLRQPLDLGRILELRLRDTQPGDRAILDESLGGHRDQRHAVARCLRRDLDGHAAADAVADGDEAADAQLLAQRGKRRRGLLGDEVPRRPSDARVGTAEPEAVVRDHASPGGGGQQRGKVAPEFDAAQRVVQQHDGCRGRLDGVGLPLPREQAAGRMGDPVVGQVDGAHGSAELSATRRPGSPPPGLPARCRPT